MTAYRPRLARSALATCALIALAACGEQAATTATTPAADVAAPAGPELGTFGVALEDGNPSIKPGDDFFRYVNGTWIDTFQMPDEYSSYGSFTVLSERSEERVRGIIEEAAAKAPAGSEAQKVGDFFASFLDQKTIEINGLQPVAEDLATIAALSDHAAVAAQFGRADIISARPVSAFVSVDARRPDQYTAHLSQSGLGMPNRDYYLEEKFADKRSKYRTYIATILSLAEYPDADAAAEAIFNLENEIARVHWELAKRRNRDLTYNLKTRAELAAFAPALDWDAMLKNAGLDAAEELIVREDDAVAKTADIFAATPVETWRAYLSFHLLHATADVLPSAFDEAKFAFFGTELRGAPKQRERWKRSVSAVDGAMGEAVGRIYVEKYFPESSKTQMQDLVANLKTAFGARLETLEWMSPETRAQALDKLAKFNTKIGYPDKWRDYSSLNVVRGDAYGNAKRAAAFAWEYNRSKLGSPVDRLEWGMNPQTVNAYYNSTLNEIVFPAAILQPPFFDPFADPAVNYGGIGAVIGHEIGHGFDDQGRKSDGDGVLRDWWTADDAAKFQERASRLGAQYAKFEPVPGFPINPALTMGENIGDLGGLAMAYHAYRLSLNGEEAPVIDGLTGDQRFFLAWAQVWKRIVREEQLKNQIATDSHSPAEYRVNGIVRNMDAWYAAFSVEPGDALYLPPEERVQIW